MGESVSIWVLARGRPEDDTTGRDQGADGHSGGELCKTMTLTKLHLRREVEPASPRMQYSDTDINGHVNNSRYADFACDVLEMQDLEPDHFLSYSDRLPGRMPARR